MKCIFSQKRTKTILIFIWVISLLISLPFIKIVEYSINPNQCHLNAELRDIVYILSYNIIVLFFPAIALTVLYIFIIIKLKKRNRNFRTIIQFQKYRKSNADSQSTINSLYSNYRADSRTQYIEEKISLRTIPSCLNQISILSRPSSSKKKSKFTIIFLIMAIVFFCCQLPVRIFQCWSYLHFYTSSKNAGEGVVEQLSELELKFINILSQALSLIYFLHCISNPIIYNIQSSKFRNFLYFKMDRNRKAFIV